MMAAMTRPIVGVLVAMAITWGGVLAQGPGPLRPGEVLQGDAARRIDDYLTRLVPHGFSGTVLIAADGHVVLKKAYGFANRAANQLYTVDMVSCIGSVSKQFTGAAIGCRNSSRWRLGRTAR